MGLIQPTNVTGNARRVGILGVEDIHTEINENISICPDDGLDAIYTAAVILGWCLLFFFFRERKAEAVRKVRNKSLLSETS